MCAHADSYPSRPIRLIVAQAPGGQNDAIARMLAPALSDALKQPIVIENRGGVGGTIGADVVAKAPPDGYTLLLGGSNNLAIAVSLHRNLPYNPVRDFVPVRGIARISYALAVNANVPARTVDDLVTYARANPGRLTYGSGGNGSTSGLAAELFKSVAGIDIVQIPYKGSAPAVADLVSGNVDIMFADLALVQQHAKAGRLRLLAAAGEVRAPGAPELATLAEQGYPGFAVSAWYAVVAPAATPAAVIATLDEALAQAVRTDELRQRLLQQGYEPIDAPAPVLGAMIRGDIARFASIINSAGIRGEQ
ncbi:MAG TPA: tripartite tricarboxylate transporter substrate-binding protein [Casimicrobiaceae bacterium]|nr:tripartite tricarboxylate transporter substrate-binding protein [Casimicrobiaceae bacterium]